MWLSIWATPGIGKTWPLRIWMMFDELCIKGRPATSQWTDSRDPCILELRGGHEALWLISRRNRHARAPVKKHSESGSFPLTSAPSKKQDTCGSIGPRVGSIISEDTIPTCHYCQCLSPSCYKNSSTMLSISIRPRYQGSWLPRIYRYMRNSGALFTRKLGRYWMSTINASRTSATYLLAKTRCATECILS